MKKTLFLLLVIMNINYVCAESEDNIAYIKYKWYIEERVDTKYYPKKDNLSGYYEDPTIVKYSEQTQWSKSYCKYNQDNYLIESLSVPKYKKPIDTKYITLNISLGIGVKNYKNIKIFYDEKQINYEVLTNNSNITKLELEKQYDTLHIHFYIETELKYSISLFNDAELTKLSISYSVNPEQDGFILYPTKEWISPNTIFIQEATTGTPPASPLIKDITNEAICRVKEINTLRYKIKKKYYDDNYHTYVEGYLPDINERIIYYKETTTSTKETPIVKTKIETKIKNIKEKIYEYLLPQKETIYKEVYKDKYIYKKIIPKKIYIIIIILFIIILIETIKILFKNDS